ncbi:hypothetical protein CC80DRAFT_549947 [Byssothecium circinans]|uniref:Uncharacterized protein n=1 Tax=Byssothecium circinans TaxID=147558 RepID=A0A6A5TR68_9PLEO|nr:hypothetical protein CC80DRAFT_549947 [Byssothecium circinans]
MWETPLHGLLFLFMGLLLYASSVRAQTSTQPLPRITGTPSLLSQHFIHPAKNDVLVTGGTFTIRWTVIPDFNFVTIQLWDKTSYGYSRDLLTPCSHYSRNALCGTISDQVPNTGSFEWQIPSPANNTNSAGYPFPRGEKRFWIKMFVEGYMQNSTGNKEPVISYSQNFAFAKEGEEGTVVSIDTATMTETGGWPLETVVWTTTSLESSSGVGRTVTGKAGTTTTAAVTKIPGGNGTVFGDVEGTGWRGRQNLVGAGLKILGLV